MPASIEFFRQFPARYFVETGTYRGQGVEMALAAGFPVVHSVELSLEHQNRNCRKFAANPNVHLYQGESIEHLGAILKSIDAPAVFWLDAHFSGDDTAKGSEICPVMAELELIKRHLIKTHTILIDDRRLLGTVHMNQVTEQQIRDLILSISPRYRFSHRTGSLIRPEFQGDVLVAVPGNVAIGAVQQPELSCR